MLVPMLKDAEKFYLLINKPSFKPQIQSDQK